MQIIERSLSELKPYKKNAKKHPPEQIERLAKSLERFGWVQPLVVNSDGVIVIGHGRYAAANYLGYETAPCLSLDDLSEEEEKALRLADNKLNESPWDDVLLAEELDSIFDIDMGDFGFVLEKEEKPEEVEGDVPFTEVLNEESQYIVLKFSNSVDWLQLESIFPLRTVKAYSTRKDGKISDGMMKKGVGRIVDGAKFLESLGLGV